MLSLRDVSHVYPTPTEGTIRSGAQVVRLVTERRPTHAGVDPYNHYIDRSSRDNVRPVAEPE